MLSKTNTKSVVKPFLHLSIATRQHCALSSLSRRKIEVLAPLAEGDEWFEIDGPNVQLYSNINPGFTGVADANGELPCDTKAVDGHRKIRSYLNCNRTHNEQILSRCCGVIFAQATFFGAEAVSNYLVFVKNACSVPGAHKPEHVFYDTNYDVKHHQVTCISENGSRTSACVSMSFTCTTSTKPLMNTASTTVIHLHTLS